MFINLSPSKLFPRAIFPLIDGPDAERLSPLFKIGNEDSYLIDAL